MRKACAVFGVLFCLFGPALPCRAFTQRQINSLAAELLNAHTALVEAPGLRRPQEPLAVYFGRLFDLMPGEKPAARRVRVTATIERMQRAVDRAASLRQAPSPREASAANRALWQQIRLNISDVFAYLVKARHVWIAEAFRPGPPAETAKSMAQAVWHLQNAYAALRDALP